MPSLTPSADSREEAAQRVAERPALGTSRIELPAGQRPSLQDARRLRYVRRQRSTSWLISDARRRVGLDPHDGTASEWVRPVRPARCRWRVAAQVGVHRDADSAHWSGLERCASIWACPVCSAVIRAERARDVQTAVDRWRETGGHTVMVTLTVRHRVRDALAVGLGAVVTGWQKLMAQKVWRSLKSRHGIAGYVRSVEVTWTRANGWHPHVHALLFLERDLTPVEAAALQAAIFDVWSRIVVRLGARRPDAKHGVVITRGAAQYVAKVQEHDRAGVEMTRFDLKRSRTAAGFMPFELLDVEGGDAPRAEALWSEYVEATTGRRAITWSRGLRDLLSLDEDLTDDQVIEQAERAALRVLIDGEQYDRRLRNAPGAAAAVLELLEDGNVELAAALAGGTVVA